MTLCQGTDSPCAKCSFKPSKLFFMQNICIILYRSLIGTSLFATQMHVSLFSCYHLHTFYTTTSKNAFKCSCIIKYLKKDLSINKDISVLVESPISFRKKCAFQNEHEPHQLSGPCVNFYNFLLSFQRRQ